MCGQDNVHPYFVEKARGVFVTAKGDPGKSGALAVWAQGARRRDRPPAGVCVAEDGRVLAETVHVDGRGVGATYVETALDPVAVDVVNREVGLACGALARKAGCRVIHVTFSDVCLGQGRRAE